MHGIEPVLEINRLALYSGYIEGEKPLSLLLAAPVSAGKSTAIMSFQQLDGIVLINSFTPTGFLMQFGHQLDAGQLRHIMIPDLLTPLAKSWEAQHALITFLNGLTEEGISGFASLYIRRQFTNSRAVGIIAGVTKQRILNSRRQWSEIGFLSRMLPVSWDYSDQTVEVVLNQIVQRIGNPAEHLQFPAHPVQVVLPQHLGHRIYQQYTGSLARLNNTYGFREQSQFQKLALASALRDGRDVVVDADVDYLQELSQVINLDFNRL